MLEILLVDDNGSDVLLGRAALAADGADLALPRIPAVVLTAGMLAGGP